MSYSRNHRLEWKPEPSFKLKWNKPVSWLLVGLFLLSSIKGASADQDMTTIYRLHCLDNMNGTHSSDNFSKDRLFENMHQVHLSLSRTGHQLVNCSLSEEAVNPLNADDLAQIIGPAP